MIIKMLWNDVGIFSWMDEWDGDGPYWMNLRRVGRSAKSEWVIKPFGQVFIYLRSSWRMRYSFFLSLVINTGHRRRLLVMRENEDCGAISMACHSRRDEMRLEGGQIAARDKRSYFSNNWTGLSVSLTI